mmetsp:Transcript_22210/g.31911  ORF Transcript_22210/g.31911 Transcript_22210/m.31911 type:complete len:222 (+) Transcript_22210:20-685(+)
MQIQIITFFCVLSIIVGVIDAFAGLKSSLHANEITGNRIALAKFRLNSAPPSFISEPIQSYVNIWTPMMKSIAETGLLPEYVTHWGHGAAMATVIFVVAGLGAAFGWQIRLGNGSGSNFLTLQKSFQEMHPIVMRLAILFFVLGGQGGLVLLACQDKPILESPHAVSALIALSLLFFQSVTPAFFEKGGPLARSIHAYLGSAIMLVLFYHGYTGLQLGLSF